MGVFTKNRHFKGQHRGMFRWTDETPTLVNCPLQSPQMGDI